MNEIGNNNNTLTLTSNWLDASYQATATNASNISVFSNANCGYVWGDYWYPYYRPIIQTITTVDHRPIRLTMSEVERLRVAAKKDKDLKATLEKFTDLIEVVVDFK